MTYEDNPTQSQFSDKEEQEGEKSSQIVVNTGKWLIVFHVGSEQVDVVINYSDNTFGTSLQEPDVENSDVQY